MDAVVLTQAGRERVGGVGARMCAVVLVVSEAFWRAADPHAVAVAADGYA
jgi:hypothetical protein